MTSASAIPAGFFAPDRSVSVFTLVRAVVEAAFFLSLMLALVTVRTVSSVVASPILEWLGGKP